MAKHLKTIAITIILLLITVGVYFRFYQITQNTFFYYDEGLYLSDNRDANVKLERNLKSSRQNVFSILGQSALMGLKTGKFLWYFLSDLRILFLGVEAWYFPRILAAIFGCLTLWMVYLFAKQYYESRWIGLLSVAMLAIYPSHIYYSRLAMQETFTGFCFIAGLYFYFASKKLSLKTYLAGFIFACVFFTSYRMIILPVFVGFCELFNMLSKKEKFQFKKYIVCMLSFVVFVLLVSQIDNWRNTRVILKWMFYQSDLASENQFEWFNLLSYPYYLFKLESVVFGLAFFGNIYLAIKKRWSYLMPFALACLYMAIFTLPEDKASRYICAAMPFIAMSSAAFIVDLYHRYQKMIPRVVVLCCVFIMTGVHLVKANTISQFRNDYKKSMDDILARNPQTKILSTQFTIQKLHTDLPYHVFEAPHNSNLFYVLHSWGCEYLIIDPQAYVSYTKGDLKFNPPLEDYLGFVVPYVKPIKVYDHFHPAFLERFVLEHNENLRRSLKFLKGNADGQLGQLKVYDIKQTIAQMQSKINANKR